MEKRSHKALRIAAALALSGAPARICPAAVYHVYPGGPTNIQACAALLQPGDTCVVHAGVYGERVTTAGGGTNGAPVTFRSEGHVAMRGFRVNHPRVRILGFAITGHASPYGAFVEFGPNGSYGELSGATVGDGIGISLPDVEFHDNGPANDTITSATGDFLAAGFTTGVTFSVTGDPALLNDANLQVKAVTANAITVADGQSLVDEGPTNAYLRVLVKGVLFDDNGPAPTNAATACLIVSNTFRNIHYTGLDVFGSGHVIAHNDISGLNGYDAFRVFGAGHRIARNVVRDCPTAAGNRNHPDFVQTFGDNGHASYNITVEQNVVLDFDGQMGMLTHDGHPDIRDWTIRSNVFARVAAQMNVGLPGAVIVNNTFFDTTRNTGHPVILTSNDSEWAENAVVKNNAFADCGSLPDNDGTRGWYTVDPGFEALTNLQADHNFVCGPAAQGYPSKPGFAGVETNGVNGGNPLFLNESNVLGDDGTPFTADDGLRPMPSSPLHGSGEGGLTIGAYASVVLTGNTPVAYFTVSPASGYEPLPVVLDASPSLAPNAVADYAWALGDGGAATGAVVSHTYTGGTFTAALTVTDTSGASNRAERTLHVHPVFQPGLLLYLPLDGGAADVSGRAHASGWTGPPAYGAGRLREGAVFDGTTTGAHVTVAHASDLDGTPGLTVAAWARKQAAALGGPLVLKHTVYRMECGSNSAAGYVFSSTSNRSVSAAVANADTNWHHYALTYDGTNVQLLFDGVPAGAPGALSNTLAVKPDRDVRVGENPWGTNFHGTLDEVRIYDRALPSGEVMWATAPHGTPLWWLDVHGLTNGSLAHREASDADGDRMPAWQERIAGTSPTNGASVLRIESVAALSAAETVVTWQSASNRVYDIYRATNLLHGFAPHQTDIPADPPLNTHTDNVAGLPGGACYRVRVRP